MNCYQWLVCLLTLQAVHACSSSDGTDIMNPSDTIIEEGENSPPLVETPQSLPVDEIVAPPVSLVQDLSLDTNYYAQYLDIDGLSLLASEQVSGYALLEARWVVKNMLRNRDDILAAIAQTNTRLAVMAVNEFTTDIPEHSDLTPKDYWDRRARGLGATAQRPAMSAGEENILQLTGDPYENESILVHEFAHVIHQQGLISLDSSFNQRIEALYQQAMSEDLWQNTYAATNASEYFAEAVQSWFGTNRENDSEHNDINTREELLSYDPRVAAFLSEVFIDNTWHYVGPIDRQSDIEHLVGFVRSDAASFVWPDRLVNVDISNGPGVDPSLPVLQNVLAEDWSTITSPSGQASAARITFDNRSDSAISVRWVDFEGQRIEYSNLNLMPGESSTQLTFAGHLWEAIRVSDQNVVARFRAVTGNYLAIIE